MEFLLSIHNNVCAFAWLVQRYQYFEKIDADLSKKYKIFSMTLYIVNAIKKIIIVNEIGL